MKTDNLLIVADTESDANLRYATGHTTAEPFIYLRLRGRSFAVVSDVELKRARKGLRHCEVVSISTYQQKSHDREPRRNGFAPVIHKILREHRLKKILVPDDFPLALARELSHLNVKLKLKRSPLFPSREFKTAHEIKRINAALTMAEVGLAEGLLALRAARIGRNGYLTLNNAPLTSEKLRSIIDTATLQAGGQPFHTVVACGRQSLDPYERGHGPLRANEPIILSLAPRSKKTGYRAVVTRTVVKGRASETLGKVYRTVSDALDRAVSSLQPNSRAEDLHWAIQSFFENNGFSVKPSANRSRGSLHSTGHGLGLEQEEPPEICPGSPHRLLPGQVVALHPALYAHPHGGVRLENVVHITANGARNLTKFETTLEI